MSADPDAPPFNPDATHPPQVPVDLARASLTQHQRRRANFKIAKRQYAFKQAVIRVLSMPWSPGWMERLEGQYERNELTHYDRLAWGLANAAAGDSGGVGDRDGYVPRPPDPACAKLIALISGDLTPQLDDDGPKTMAFVLLGQRIPLPAVSSFPALPPASE